MRELSIVQAFDNTRIRGDAEAKRAKSLGGYLDELLTDEERLEKSAAALTARFDAAIFGGEETDTIKREIE